MADTNDNDKAKTPPTPPPSPPPHSDDDGWLEWVRKGDDEPNTSERAIRRIITPDETNTVKRIIEEK